MSLLETCTPADSKARVPADEKIKSLEQEARDMARSVEKVRQQTFAQANERIAALEQKARDLACFVETTRQQTLLQSDRKAEALEQKARNLADFVESLRNQTSLPSESEFEALGQQVRDLALSMEAVRKETRLQSETEIELLGQHARDLAVSVETVSEETLLHSNMEIQELQEKARSLALTAELSRLATLMESDRVIRKLNAELEQRVLERTGQLEAANKELESFSYSVSHDLRAPLRAIDGFSRIVLEDFAEPLADEGKAYLNLVRDNTRKMGKLVDELLAFSRLGRLELTKQTVDPGKMVRLCLTEMQTELAGRQLEIVIGDLPSCQADATLLKQVWLNLLSNALKYTHKREIGRIEIGCKTQPRPTNLDCAQAGRTSGGHKPEAQAKDLPAPPSLALQACGPSAIQANGQASISTVPGAERVYFVKDNGAGFDMKYVHKLFGVFQRLHREADYNGTGVGLAIVQRIVHRHGGRVWGEAQIDQGATFSFTLE